MLPEEAEMTVRRCVEPRPPGIYSGAMFTKGEKAFETEAVGVRVSVWMGQQETQKRKGLQCLGLVALCSEPSLALARWRMKALHTLRPPGFCSQLGRAVVLRGPCLHSFILL